MLQMPFGFAHPKASRKKLKKKRPTTNISEITRTFGISKCPVPVPLPPKLAIIISNYSPQYLFLVTPHIFPNCSSSAGNNNDVSILNCAIRQAMYVQFHSRKFTLRYNQETQPLTQTHTHALTLNLCCTAKSKAGSTFTCAL